MSRLPESTFIHLQVHSEYSLVDGLLRIPDLLQAAKEAGMHSVALTEQSNLFAMIKFYQAAEKSGVKPIFGADVWVKPNDFCPMPQRLSLLAENDLGFQHLMRLISRSYTEGLRDGLPEIEKAWLLEAKTGLLVISPMWDSELSWVLSSGHPEQAFSCLQAWMAQFPDAFYLEVVRVGRAAEAEQERKLLDLAMAGDCPLVASNAVRFLKPEDFEAHEARICIHQGVTLSDEHRPRVYTEQQYFRSISEMQSLFADLPEALLNTVEIAKRCTVRLSLGKVCLPAYPIPEQETPESFLCAMAEQGLQKRAEKQAWPNIPAAYQERLATELSVINNMGFAGYFLIVADFIRWAKDNGVPVGPGRGSGVGSLVAYALDITDLDPLVYGLLFERFLNPERVSMPDFDIDFCMDGRDRVIDYVAQKYGRIAVSQIITYGTMAAKAVIRDVGRVLGFPYGFVDKIAKLIPLEVGITLERAMAEEPLLKERYEQEEDVQSLFDLAKKLEGITRNAGKHAGGVVIAPNRLTDFTPVYCDADGALLTQLDKNDVESAGLVKFDFLGLRTLTIIDWTLKSVNAQRKMQGLSEIQIDRIPLNDPKTFVLLQNCQTTAVFQLESRGMKDLVRRLRPDTFEDIIALGALFRPGPLQSGMVDDFVDRKRGHAPIEYLHPALETVLKPTYGIILYQEQVMQTAQVLASYTLGGADLLRRAMGKKKPEEMAKQRSIFLAGALQNGVSESLANDIFDLIDKFSGYGFNKSHAAGYALITYQTAWLKAHFPAHFMAAVLSSDMSHTDKVVLFLEEAKHMGLEILPPNVNLSEEAFVVNADQAIVYGLGAIKGVGSAAIAHLKEAREAGPFLDFWDLCRKVDGHKVTKRVLEALIKSGALDVLNPNRAQLMADLSAAMQAAEQFKKNSASGQGDLFAEWNAESASPAQNCAGSKTAPWSELSRLRAEKETLGLCLSGHPMQVYLPLLQPLGTVALSVLKPDRQRRYLVAGLLLGLRVIQTKRGSRMAIATIEDQSGRQELVLFSDAYDAYRPLLEKDQLLVMETQVSEDHFSGGLKVRCQRLWTLSQARGQLLSSLVLRCDPERLALLRPLLQPYLLQKQEDDKGAVRGCVVSVFYENAEAKARLTTGKLFNFPDFAVIEQLRALCGESALQLTY